LLSGQPSSKDDLLALDLESPDATRHMSFDESAAFHQTIKEKTGRYPLIYANNLVTKAIAEQYGRRDLAKRRIWVCGALSGASGLSEGTWKPPRCGISPVK